MQKDARRKIAAMSRKPAKRVAVIGAGPSGAIAVDALAQEQAFDLIRVFERREAAGGCWIGDKEERNPPYKDLAALATRTADLPLPVPSRLPAYRPSSTQPRFAESSIYPYLETNVVDLAMQFSQEPVPQVRSERSVGLYGDQTPFRSWTVMRRYVESLMTRKGYEDLVSYNTSVELVEKVGEEWKITLRQGGKERDYWWAEWFDAVVVASGHFSVPYIPAIDGLDQFEKSRPGSVLHSKDFRGRDGFDGKRVVVVGAAVSAADIAFDIAETATSPVNAVVVGHTTNVHFGDEAFNHPNVVKRPSITRVVNRTVHFKDGSCVDNVDNIIFGTGYSWSLPFLPNVTIRNNRVTKLYQHIVYQDDPSLMFVGAVGAGLTFKIFEWQAVYAARLLAGRGTLPSAEEMRQWEEERMQSHGDGPRFALVYPDFEEYFEKVRALAGEPTPDGKGRPLPKFRREWYRAFLDGHEKRKGMWRRLNEKAREDRESRGIQAKI